MITKKKQPKNTNQWLVFTTMPVQMGVTIYVFYKIGEWLDKKCLIMDNWGTKIVTLLGIFVALYQIISQVNKLSKNE